jgi:hypothetical protein
MLADDTSRICGKLPMLDELSRPRQQSTRRVKYLGGEFSLDNSRDLKWKLTIPNQTKRLVVTMNGEVDILKQNHFSIFLNHPSGNRIPGACQRTDQSTFGACELNAPEAGIYSVVLAAKRGKGKIQVGASIFMKQSTR